MFEKILSNNQTDTLPHLNRYVTKHNARLPVDKNAVKRGKYFYFSLSISFASLKWIKSKYNALYNCQTDTLLLLNRYVTLKGYI